MNNKELFAKYSIFCKNVKFFRKQIGLTQEQLAEKCDLSVSYIKQIESGKYFKNISYIVLFKISKGLNIEINELFIQHIYNIKQLIP